MAYNPEYAKKTVAYKNEYNRQKYKRISLTIRNDDEEVLAMLDAQPSVNAYILQLIKDDIERKRSN